MNEVLTQTVPYSDAMTEQVQLHTILEARYNHEALTAAITADGVRPARLDGAHGPLGELSALSASCWANDAARRPGVSVVAAQLGALLAAVGGLPDPGCFFTGESKHPAAGDATVDLSDSGAPTFTTQDDIRSEIELMHAMAATVRTSTPMAETSVMMRVGWEASPGRRGADRMEDRVIALTITGLALAAVFDGHNGDAAAEYCKRHLVHVLAKQLSISGAPPDVAGAMRAAFPELNESFTGSMGADDSGCTALAAVCTPTSVHVANAGDCRCVLWRTNPTSGQDELVPLNDEHTASLPEERARVEAAGASISQTADGKHRVGGIIQESRPSSPGLSSPCLAGFHPLSHLVSPSPLTLTHPLSPSLTLTHPLSPSLGLSCR